MPGAESRAAVVAVVLAFVLVAGACLPFTLTGADVPGAVVLLGRWLPGLASLLAVLVVLGRGHLVRLWRVRPFSPRELLGSWALALGVVLPAVVAPALVGLALGAELKPVGVLAAAVPVVVAGTVVFALSTLGEEVLWRGQLQHAVRRFGFWPSSVLVGVVWVLWHLPLHLTYLAQGQLSATEVTALTLGLLAWAPLLAALVEHRGTIWPAVFAHAVPLSSLQLLADGAAGQALVFWGVTVTGWAALVVAALAVRARTAATGTTSGHDTSPPCRARAAGARPASYARPEAAWRPSHW
ncbi:type II CAAX prenyl endopeptidase Rce1 family protein [uncultured Pseudokineococcus sp.]|uniref:CPBP family glutamic-type intramembrane protease n=1 Tax=uncultured Pseudokineococcus sp. TaxID=1642928 RepID=UPI0026396A0A|nr:CPBP family glutamic-type intramembrane protease [uncultured Pseudokineococcus sp.]